MTGQSQKDQRKKEKLCAQCAKPFWGSDVARLGPCCRWKARRDRPKKYFWTEERDQMLRERYDGKVKHRAREIAESWGWPVWCIKKRAQQLGLSYSVERKAWTKDEEKILLDLIGNRTVPWVAKKLHRSTSSVVLKLKRMHISRRFRAGYTLRDLQLCFGTNHNVIERWVREGWLVIKRRGTNRPHDAWLVTDADILRFIQNHPMAFRLDKVDQLWFMDLIANAGLLAGANREINGHDAYRS